jgi:hypothetical protein
MTTRGIATAALAGGLYREWDIGPQARRSVWRLAPTSGASPCGITVGCGHPTARTGFLGKGKGCGSLYAGLSRLLKDTAT